MHFECMEYACSSTPAGFPSQYTEAAFLTRPLHEKAQVLWLASLGWNASEIARVSGIPRLTVRDWMVGKGSHLGRSPSRCPVCSGQPAEVNTPDYAYLFGQYLGDGML